jgi:hypothetical protein
MEPIDGMIMNSGWEGIWKKTFVVLSDDTAVDSSVEGEAPRFEPGTRSRDQSVLV